MREQGSGIHTRVGLMESFSPGEYEHVDRVLSAMDRLGLFHLRLAISWDDYHSDAGRRWYNWLLPQLARRTDVLPCVTCTPPPSGPNSSMTPSAPTHQAQLDFLDQFIAEHGEHFTSVELRMKFDDLTRCDPTQRDRLTSGQSVATEMLVAAAQRNQECGKRTVLGGLLSKDPTQLDRLALDGVLQHVDVLGINAMNVYENAGRWHALAGARSQQSADLSTAIPMIRRVLDHHNIGAEIWVTEDGFSTVRGDEYAQLQHFASLVSGEAERVYWHSAFDTDPESPTLDGFRIDERHSHYGLFRKDGRPKLLPRIWSEEGMESVITLAELGRRHGISNATTNGGALRNGRMNGRHGPGAALNGRLDKSSAIGRNHQSSDPLARNHQSSGPLTRDHQSSIAAKRVGINLNGSAVSRYTLITGGAGFIGTNMAERLLDAGRRVRILDNLSRPGVEKNLQWLCRRYGDRVDVQLEDIRDPRAVREAVLRADQVFHFAAQVAVTTSMEYPREDFEINVCGTLNVLEAIRCMAVPPPLLFTSTNKVYGSLDDVEVDLEGATYRPANPDHARGIDSDRRLDFHSPYGCSKGAADTYVLDYCRMFDLPTVVFRMSCIYGPHQFGTEDQGWIAHFLFRALRGQPITIYGDGCQVRDVLFVEDLVRSMVMALNEIEHVRGCAFNVGGGAERSVSLLQVLQIIKDLHGELPEISFADWRQSDQKFYVSDTTRLEQATGWTPSVDVREGIRRLYEWIVEESPALTMEPAPPR